MFLCEKTELLNLILMLILQLCLTVLNSAAGEVCILCAFSLGLRSPCMSSGKTSKVSRGIHFSCNRITQKTQVW